MSAIIDKKTNGTPDSSYRGERRLKKLASPLAPETAKRHCDAQHQNFCRSAEREKVFHH